jgi:hypothetical protein
MQLGRFVSPVLLMGVIFCFFLPFVTISCNNGQKVATFSGTQLAIGTTMEQRQAFGPPQRREIAPYLTVSLALLCAALALALSFLAPRVAMLAAISSALAACSLLLFRSNMEDEVIQQGSGVLRAQYEVGYSAGLFLLVLATGWNGFLFFRRNRAPTPARAAAAAAGSHSAARLFCSRCGRPAPPGSAFCNACGGAVQ